MRRATRIWALLRWLGCHELGVLLSVLAVAGGVWAFIELADEVVEHSTRRFDRWVLLALRAKGDLTDPIGPRWFEEMARDITALGGSAVLLLLTAAIVGFLLLRRERRTAVFILLTVIGAELVSTVLKLGFERPRPTLVPHAVYVYTSSFPSGHAMLSAAVYLTLGALLAHLQERAVIKAYLLIWAVGITILVGLSRVYLGVHWPTDVLGGWAAGAAWAALWWLGARAMERRRTKPRERSDPGEPP